MEKFGKKVDVAQKAASLGVAGSEFNLGVGAGSGSVSGGVSAALPSFYHPKLSFMYEVPQSHSQLLEWIDLFFTWNPYIYSIITMHSHYVSSKFNFMGESVVTDFLNKNLFNQCGVYDVIKDAALSWWKYGEVFLVGDWVRTTQQNRQRTIESSTTAQTKYHSNKLHLRITVTKKIDIQHINNYLHAIILLYRKIRLFKAI